MVAFYLDTSAFVKRYKSEAGTEFVDKLYKGFEAPDRAVTSFLGVLEFVATARRLLKAEEIDSEDFREMVATFVEEIREYYTLRPLDDEVVSAGIEKVVDHALKSADSIHLATALEMEKLLDEVGGTLVFIAADEELCEAANREGLKTINPRDKQSREKLSKYTGGEK